MKKMYKTSLYENHLSLKAKILPFAGYLMPINYEDGIQSEYKAVRNDVGLFDVSHMGQIIINGRDSSKLLKKITVNNIDNLSSGQAHYSALCNHSGGIIDDIIIYKLSEVEYLLVVNGANREKVYDWIKIKNKDSCNIDDKTFKSSLIAIQGPNSREYLEEFLNCKIDLKFYTHKYYTVKSQNILVSRTGYTGELGFELLGKSDGINAAWDYFINKKVKPCGLAVRDILRMEMKYCLYGNDINESITPIEAGLGWIINNQTDFIGKQILIDQKKKGVTKKLVCISMEDRCIPRTGYKIISNDLDIGKVVSGTFSSQLNTGIALAYLNTEFDRTNPLYVEIRNKLYSGKIVRPPFINNTSLHN
jgi:aminomethyltransferase